MKYVDKLILVSSRKMQKKYGNFKTWMLKMYLKRKCMKHAKQGSRYFITPRHTVKSYPGYTSDDQLSYVCEVLGIEVIHCVPMIISGCIGVKFRWGTDEID